MVIWVLSAAALAGVNRPEPLKIVSVTILESGHLAPEDVGIDAPDRCKFYHPTRQQVLRWFTHARRVAVATWMELDRPQCWARGMLTTADGKSYRWDLD